MSEICKQFCKDPDLKIVFTSFKINNYFSTKDKTPYFWKSFLVYHVILVSDEHVKKRQKSNTYKHIHNNTILDYTPNSKLKLKNVMYIDWEKLNLKGMLWPIFYIDINTHSDKKPKNYVRFI